LCFQEQPEGRFFRPEQPSNRRDAAGEMNLPVEAASDFVLLPVEEPVNPLKITTLVLSFWRIRALLI
jgi:hypothetical protein